ncbi:MAG TPA: sigma-70 family RNA polymerase sigma factor [Steroidobacter sp.]
MNPTENFTVTHGVEKSPRVPDTSAMLAPDDCIPCCPEGMVGDMIEPLEQWFAREVLAHEASLMRYLLRVWPWRDEVTDLRQEIYVRVFDAARAKRPTAAKSFLFTAARNLMTDRLRRSRITFIGTRADVDALEILVDEISPEQRLTGLQELTWLAHAFDSLPPKCRAVMWLRKVEQLSQKDVAARLGVREKAIEKQVARGMRLLAKALLERGRLDPATESFGAAGHESSHAWRHG